MELIAHQRKLHITVSPKFVKVGSFVLHQSSALKENQSNALVLSPSIFFD